MYPPRGQATHVAQKWPYRDAALGREQEAAYEGSLNGFTHLRKRWSEGGAFVEEGAYRPLQLVDLYCPPPVWVVPWSCEGEPYPQVPDCLCRRDRGHGLFPQSPIRIQGDERNMLDSSGCQGGSVVALSRIKPNSYRCESRGDRMGGLSEIGVRVGEQGDVVRVAQ